MAIHEINAGSNISRINEHGSKWEVSDFSSNGDSIDEWLPQLSRIMISEDGHTKGS